MVFLEKIKINHKMLWFKTEKWLKKKLKTGKKNGIYFPGFDDGLLLWALFLEKD